MYETLCNSISLDIWGSNITAALVNNPQVQKPVVQTTTHTKAVSQPCHCVRPLTTSIAHLTTGSFFQALSMATLLLYRAPLLMSRSKYNITSFATPGTRSFAANMPIFGIGAQTLATFPRFEIQMQALSPRWSSERTIAYGLNGAPLSNGHLPNLSLVLDQHIQPSHHYTWWLHVWGTHCEGPACEICQDFIVTFKAGNTELK